jgi:hypothetical protein
MSVNYLKAKDVFISRRTIDGKFEEYPLIVEPDSFIMCNSCMDLVAVPGTFSGSSGGFILVTGSLYPITSSWSLTSSYFSGSVIGFIPSSSYSLTSSFVDGYLKLNQTIPQSVINGPPNFVGGLATSAYKITGSIVSYQTSTKYTLTNNDDGKVVSINNSSPVNIEVSGSLYESFNCLVYQSGSGQITFVPESGYNIRNSLGSTQTKGQYCITTLLRITNTDFILAGDVQS